MAKKDWRPRDTHVVIVGLGLEEWADPDDPTWRRHETLAKVFRKAGVPTEQVVLVEDDDATPEKLRELLPRVIGQVPDDGLFVFYYAGHGALDEDEGEGEGGFYFCHPTVEDDALYGHELMSMIEENLAWANVVLLADCCFSGSLARLLEGLETEGSYAALTSATDEVESTGAWTFTDCLLAALRGDASIDADADGTITFRELCDHVLEQMATVEQQPADYTHTSAFDPSFRLAVVKALRGVSAGRGGARRLRRRRRGRRRRRRLRAAAAAGRRAARTRSRATGRSP